MTELRYKPENFNREEFEKEINEYIKNIYIQVDFDDGDKCYYVPNSKKITIGMGLINRIYDTFSRSLPENIKISKYQFVKYVLCHELGHFIDISKNKNSKEASENIDSVLNKINSKTTNQAWRNLDVKEQKQKLHRMLNYLDDIWVDLLYKHKSNSFPEPEVYQAIMFTRFGIVEGQEKIDFQTSEDLAIYTLITGTLATVDKDAQTYKRPLIDQQAENLISDLDLTQLRDTRYDSLQRYHKTAYTKLLLEMADRYKPSDFESDRDIMPHIIGDSMNPEDLKKALDDASKIFQQENKEKAKKEEYLSKLSEAEKRVKKYTSTLLELIIKILETRKTKTVITRTYSKTGRIGKRTLLRKDISPKDSKIFYKKQTNEQNLNIPNFDFSARVLVDDSGSMSSVENVALEIMVVLQKVLHGLQKKSRNADTLFLEFGEDVGEFTSSIQTLPITFGQATEEFGKALDKTIRNLEQSQNNKKIIFVITDGNWRDNITSQITNKKGDLDEKNIQIIPIPTNLETMKKFLIMLKDFLPDFDEEIDEINIDYLVNKFFPKIIENILSRNNSA